jgi:hypothetical protein
MPALGTDPEAGSIRELGLRRIGGLELLRNQCRKVDLIRHDGLPQSPLTSPPTRESIVLREARQRKSAKVNSWRSLSRAAGDLLPESIADRMPRRGAPSRPWMKSVPGHIDAAAANAALHRSN